MSTEAHSHSSNETTAPNQTDTTEADKEQTPTLSATISIGSVQRFLDAIRTVNSKCHLEVTSDALVAHTASDDRAMMATIRLGGDAFESYEATSGGIDIETGRLREITRINSNSDTMQFAIDPTDDTLSVEANGMECSLQPSQYLRIPSVSDIDEPDHPSVCVFEGHQLQRIIKGAGHIGSQVEFRIEHTRERFVAEATNDSDGRLVAPRDGDDVVELLAGDVPVASTYDLSYLRKVRRPLRKRTEVTVALGTEKALSVAFDIADGAGNVEYALAPVISDGDEDDKDDEDK